ncbi:hypothetical protein [Thioalkalivibrio sp. ALE12]|uniref:hypothetical protein n=1 Tax=Thioalkalivibrio sp. ALE12 TaxID=1158170 RepID=UPI000377B7B8|nr:hypothetical protein [Thioalkalivibrio sp. ALE12]
MNTKTEPTQPGTRAEAAVAVPRSRLSMHEGVTASCDCCSCEAEPYWAEVARELGIDPESAADGRGDHT